jgi:hypothetical protein
MISPLTLRARRPLFPSRKPEPRRFHHAVKTGVQPPITWIPFSNGMTDAVRHLDAGMRRHDELSLLLKARDFQPFPRRMLILQEIH